MQSHRDLTFMAHALIIGENVAISRAIRHYLEPLGFGSFDLAWTEQQAREAAHRQRPDIIVIGDDIEAGFAINAARQISSGSSIPVLMVSGNPAQAARCLEQASSYEGPFMLNQIEQAVAVALAEGPGLH